MLISRRNQGKNALLQDATRASSRVASQAQQTLADLADDSRSLAGTARTELGGLSREMRDQASGKVTRARRRTARKLNEAAEAVEPNGRRHRGRPVVKAALAAGAGWLLINVARKARQKADESSTPDDEAPSGTSGTSGGAETGTDKASTKSSTKARSTGGGPADRHTDEAKPAGATAGKANSSGS